MADLFSGVEQNGTATGVEIKLKPLDSVNTLDRASQAIGSRRSRYAANMDDGIGGHRPSRTRHLLMIAVADTRRRRHECRAEPDRESQRLFGFEHISSHFPYRKGQEPSAGRTAGFRCLVTVSKHSSSSLT